VDLVISAFDDEFGEVFPGAEGEKIYFVDYSFGFQFGVEIVLSWAVLLFGLLREGRNRA
jgi:hypothetical protein